MHFEIDTPLPVAIIPLTSYIRPALLGLMGPRVLILVMQRHGRDFELCVTPFCQELVVIAEHQLKTRIIPAVGCDLADSLAVDRRRASKAERLALRKIPGRVTWNRQNSGRT
jgi:hypothetical protein